MIPFRLTAAAQLSRRQTGMSSAVFWLSHCRASEKIAITFFILTAILTAIWGLPNLMLAVALLVPVVVFALACLETAHGSERTAIARDWLVPLLVLLAYWQMDWFASQHDARWEAVWLGWDRQILSAWGLRTFLERSVPILPWWLELNYLLLYAIPPACIGTLYLRRERFSVETFLVTFAFGTLSAYALLPLIAVQSPRVAFPGADLPAPNLCRSINLWILDHLDISTSVFPSGHVAVAFSSAFGIRRALPGCRRTFALFLCLAVSVWVATVYGRYHYAADGLASLGICLLCWGLLEIHDHRR